MLKESIAKLAVKENLSREEALADMREIMSGKADPVEIGSYLTALSMKGETVDEITASAEGMTEAAVQIHPQGDVLEIVGTGGDKAYTFNISTTSMFVIAAAGTHVAKHGNRGVSSKSGAADVLEQLGVKINNTPAFTEKWKTTSASPSSSRRSIIRPCATSHRSARPWVSAPYSTSSDP